MALKQVEIRDSGKTMQVPAAEICGRTVMVRGGGVKTASVLDEAVAPGELVPDPAAFIKELKQSGLRADVLTFFQRPPDVKPKFNYHFDWDNYAVVDTTSFDAWWEQLPQEARKNTRRAAKRGVVVKTVPYDDALARGIHRLCNESPVRQGKPFWHYGKDFETVKREHGTFLERSEFVAAYHEDELIGFIKMVYTDRLAVILHILAFNAHYDKRPLNALITKAVEVCAQKGMHYFVYGGYVYGNKKDSSLVEFKRRNGFARLDFPRYYIPLTLKGRIYVALRLYRGLLGLLPGPVLNLLLKLRDKIYARKQKPAAKDE
ncbi:MAG: GNAT family N-acetyltransferase [Chthoniobacter sp.]|nr:GNAT family N-acetyltransferase [Chthoniobacter sp.]